MPVQVLSKPIRDEIHRRTLAAVRREAGERATLVGLCLAFAWEGYQIIKSWPGAPRTIIQAGTASWPRVPPELDDGVSPTHFTYQWDPGSALARLLRRGIAPVVGHPDGSLAFSLPELHVWLGCPDTGELVDFTTGLWPAACQATIGADWLAPPPPEYLWTFGKRLPAGVHYVACPEAIDCVIAALHAQGQQYP